MSQYYYLDIHNVPQGPHSLDELAQFMASGRINPTTLVACKGGAQWEPLGSVLSREHIEAPDIHAAPGQVGPCPSCGHDLSPELRDYQLPVRCPACGRALRADLPGISIWSNFVQVMRNYARFSGRATRVEYWSFQLVNFLIYVATFASVFIGMAIAVSLSSVSENQYGTSIGHSIQRAMEGGHVILAIYMIFMVASLFIWMIVSIIPQLAVMVRRMHDVGWSGKWLLFSCLVALLPYFMVILLEFASAEDSGLIQVLLVTFGVSYLASYACSIFLFVLTLLDSQHGVNKYGPSSKYPLR